MDKRPQHAGLGGAQALLSGDIYRRLGKGARDKHTTLYIQAIHRCGKNGLSGRWGKIGILDTPVQESQSSNLTVFFLPLM